MGSSSHGMDVPVRIAPQLQHEEQASIVDLHRLASELADHTVRGRARAVG